MSVIRTTGLTKRYGRHRGVVALDLEVERGEVFGFLGPNGAGKTTTIRILLDLIRPTAGSAAVLGLDAQRDSAAVRRGVGYVPGELSLYDRLSGEQNLRFFASLRRSVDWAWVHALRERLDCDLQRKVADLSTGNKRKIALIQAFMHRPDLLILDEPTVGLDPLVQREFYALIHEATAAGQTVFLCSHNLPEVQRVCDRVGFVRGGRLIAVESVAALGQRMAQEVEVEFAQPVDGAPFGEVPGVAILENEGALLRVMLTGSFDAFLKLTAKYPVVRLTSREPDLEDVFLTYYQEEGVVSSGGVVDSAGEASGAR